MEAFVEETPAIVDTTKKRKSNASVAVDKFDWDAFESDAEYGVSKEEVEQMYSQTLSTVIENEVVEGTVVAVSKREVLVNIGYKSEGIISINE
ncbi:MAG: S1 RNA-binding domain-containing protein, partial [Bacteroidales bacterium]|nr:S1 RNA-binding domain-containing protein [Bacteroidales bacterium]